MALKWNALRVTEAADMAEKHINAIVEPLECAKEVCKAALAIPNLPQYIESRFHTLLSEIDNTPHRLQSKLKSLRGDIPQDAVEAERQLEAQGERPSML